MTTTTRFVEIDGLQVFVREAGEKTAPGIVLLHGFPSSSHMFRELIPLLAGRFRVIAPDLIGFGHSEAPPRKDFEYTFDHLASVVGKLLAALEVTSYVLYLHDFGGPVGMRLALAAPERVRGLVVQNANAYMEGVSEAVAGLFLPLWKEQNEQTLLAARGFLSAASTKMQYTAGARDPSRLNPDAWTLDQALLDRPGIAEAQLSLFVDYQHNVAAYESWHAYFREHQPRTLIVWGKNDPFFLPAGAEAYRRDLPGVEMVLLDGGHFALEEHAPLVAAHINRVFAAEPAMSSNQSTSSPSSIPNPTPSSLLRAALIGGLIVGVLDALDGVAFFGITARLNPIQVLQYIASGALGPSPYEGGLPTAALGALLHFVISLAVAAIFTSAFACSALVRTNLIVAGLVYGALVWAVMNLLVLPYLSRIPAQPLSALAIVHGVIGHAIFVGLAGAIAVRRSFMSAESRAPGLA